MQTTSSPYQIKTFNLRGLSGLSNKTMAMHFKLYEGYVKEANLLTEKVAEFLLAGEVAEDKLPAYAETLRRLTYERNGMNLHEYYFENLKKADAQALPVSPLFLKKVQSGFGSYEAWQADFINTGKVRGVGWAVCCENPSHGRLYNHWIFLHDIESLASLKILLVLDVWEHAFLLDYQPSEREEYTKDFFSNIDWAVVETRLLPPAGPARNIDL